MGFGRRGCQHLLFSYRQCPYMVTLRHSVFFASATPGQPTTVSACFSCLPRPFGRGEATPRRESPEGLPKVVAINRPCLAAGVLVAEWGGRCLCGGVGDCAAFSAASEGCEVGGVRSKPVSSIEARPLLHRGFEEPDLVRLLFRAGRWGVVSLLRVGRESRDDCEVNSDSDSVVAEEPELAATFACVCAGARGHTTGRFAVEIAPLFGVAG
jgi:hypothetical protein